MKYKVGDKVRVRDDLVIDRIYGVDRFVEGMKALRGSVVEISCTIGEWGYGIKGSVFCWTEEMFEGKVKSTMTKSDLKTGMIVTTRDGSEYWVLKDNTIGYDSFVDVNYKKCIPFHSYSEDFKCYIHPEKSDIIKIEEPEFFNPKASRVLLWEREEIKEVTMEEVEKKFGCKVKIVN